jgi:hypothetical protein
MIRVEVQVSHLEATTQSLRLKFQSAKVHDWGWGLRFSRRNTQTFKAWLTCFPLGDDWRSQSHFSTFHTVWFPMMLVRGTMLVTSSLQQLQVARHATSRQAVETR